MPRRTPNKDLILMVRVHLSRPGNCQPTCSSRWRPRRSNGAIADAVQPAGLGEKRLALTAIVPAAGQDVAIFASDDPPWQAGRPSMKFCCGWPASVFGLRMLYARLVTHWVFL